MSLIEVDAVVPKEALVETEDVLATAVAVVGGQGNGHGGRGGRGGNGGGAGNGSGQSNASSRRGRTVAATIAAVKEQVLAQLLGGVADATATPSVEPDSQ